MRRRHVRIVAAILAMAPWVVLLALSGSAQEGAPAPAGSAAPPPLPVPFEVSRGPGAAPAPRAAAERRAQREIVINLPALRLYLYENRRPIASYPIAIGRIVRPSVLGSTVIVNRVVDPTYYPPNWWREGLEPIPPGPDNPVGTRWLGLGIPGYGIHGTNAPWTIGTAASAGCIRMYNEDVEELFTLVGIGTPVHFVYETVQAWQQEGEVVLAVHPDLYQRGTNTVAAALEQLAAAGADPTQVFRPGLEEILAAAAGRPAPVPLQVPVRWEGRPLEPGFARAGRVYLPVEALAEAAGVRTAWQGGQLRVGGTPLPGALRHGGRTYAPANGLVAALGLAGTVGPGGADLFGVWAYREGERLPVRGWLDGQRLLLPPAELARAAGIPVPPLTSGDALLPHDQAAALLGIGVVWQPGQARAELAVPRVTLDGDKLPEPALLSPGGDVLVPLDALASSLKVPVEWDPDSQTALVGEGRRIPAFARGQHLYAPLAEVSRAVPKAAFVWDPARLAVEVRRPPVGEVVIYHAYASSNYAPRARQAQDGRPGDVVRAGSALREALEKRGVTSLHVTQVFDADGYLQAFDRAGAALGPLLAENGRVAAVLDVHRDAFKADLGKNHVTAWVDGHPVAKILLAVGQRNNPYAAENTAFAQAVLAELDRLAPGAARGIQQLPGPYNGHLHPRSLLVFLGEYTHTTLEEAEAAARLLAEAVAAVLTRWAEQERAGTFPTPAGGGPNA